MEDMLDLFDMVKEGLIEIMDERMKNLRAKMAYF